MAWPPVTHQDVQDEVSALRVRGLVSEAAAGVSTSNSGATNLANFNAWAAANPGVPIFFNAGIYDFNNATTSVSPKGSIFGAGPGVTVFRFPESSQPSVYVVNVNNFTIADLEIRSTSTTTPLATGLNSASSNHFTLDHSTVFSIRNIYCNGTANMGIHVRDVHRGSIINCRVFGTGRDGIHVTNGSTDVTVTGNQTHTTGDDGIAIVTYNEDLAQNERIAVTGNTISNTLRGTRGITCEGGKNISVSGNVIGTTNGYGIILNSIGSATTDTWTLTNCTVSGNTISDSAADGIHINGKTENLLITGNLIRSPAQAGIRVLMGRVQISGNLIDQAGTNGIALTNNVANQYSVARDNVIRRPGQQGLYCEASNFTFDGNLVQQPNVDGTMRDGALFFGCSNIVATGNRFDGTTGTLSRGMWFDSVTNVLTDQNYSTNATNGSFGSTNSTGIQVSDVVSQSLGADVTTTSTTIVDVAALMGPVVPGNYVIDAYLIDQSSSTTAGPRFAIGGTATATMTNFTVEQATSATVRTTVIGTTINTAYGASVGTATTSFGCNIHARVNVTASGTLGLRWLMSAAGTGTLKAGSYIVFTRAT